MSKLKCYPNMQAVSYMPLTLQNSLLGKLVSKKMNFTYKFYLILLKFVFFQEEDEIIMNEGIIQSDEVKMYKACAILVNEKRLKLRETLKNCFAHLKDSQIL